MRTSMERTLELGHHADPQAYKLACFGMALSHDAYVADRRLFTLDETRESKEAAHEEGYELGHKDGYERGSQEVVDKIKAVVDDY